MKLPNFFILGAPKCGTTTLSHWLAQHPEVFMSPVKEPHHFDVDYKKPGSYRNWDAYLSLFERATDQHRIVGEASPSYLRSSEAVPRIEETLPNSLYLVLLRNPVDMARSFHRQQVFGGGENVTDFYDAWHLIDKRCKGKAVPPGCSDAKFLDYRSTCLLGQQLQRLYDTVEESRVLVVFLEDIQKNVRKEWRRILLFLNVSYWDDLEFKASNKAKKWRWPWVRNLIAYTKVVRSRLEIPPLGLNIIKRLERAGSKEVAPVPLMPDFHNELIQSFSEDIDLLARITGRDLSHWKAPRVEEGEGSNRILEKQ